MSYWQNPPYYISAYGLALKHGFKGTEEEWLESLKGATFTPSLTEDGWLTWTNNKGLPNPDPVNILEMAGILPGGIRKRIEFTVKVKDWEEYETPVNGYKYYCQLKDESITQFLVPYIVVAEESHQTAQNCSMSSTAETFDGYVQLNARTIPSGKIRLDCNLMNVGSYGTDLPIADAFTLGVIKGSDTIVIDKDGTAHAKVSKSATDAEVLTMIDAVLGK